MEFGENKVIDKHDREMQCFQRAVQIALKKRGETKRILKYLNGNNVVRKEEERPDIVKLCKNDSHGQCNTIVGIEHFRVDQLSIKKKDGRIASTGIVTEKNVRNLFNKWHDEVMRLDTVPDAAVHDIGKVVAEQIQRMEVTTYDTYIHAFNYSLEQHIKSFDVYRKNLEKLAGKRYKIELALLIEIHMEFNNLCLNDKDGTSKLSSGQFPIFGDIVRLLEEKVDKRKVDYIVLCLGDTLYNDKIKVVAFRAGNVRKNIERQGVRVYEYAGEDILMSDFQAMRRNIHITPQCMFEDNQVNMEFEYFAEELDEKQRLEFMFYAFKKAYDLKRRGYCYATTMGVQMLMECMGDMVMGWKTPKHDKETWKVEPIFSPLMLVELERRIEDFEKRWFFSKEK